jgi:hypothetical protein
VIESIGTKYAMSRPRPVAAGKNEVAIETIQAPAAHGNQIVLRAQRGSGT